MAAHDFKLAERVITSHGLRGTFHNYDGRWIVIRGADGKTSTWHPNDVRRDTPESSAQSPVDPIELQLERAAADAGVAWKEGRGSGEDMHVALEALIAHRTAHTPKAPEGYQPLPYGARCKCMKSWTDGCGNYWCCNPTPPECRPPAEHEGLILPPEWIFDERVSVKLDDGLWHQANITEKCGRFYRVRTFAGISKIVARDNITKPGVARPSPEIEFDEDVLDRIYNESVLEEELGRGTFASNFAAAILATFKSPSPIGEQVDPTDEAIEVAAQAVYDDFECPDGQVKPKWHPGGNSHKQTEARIYARSALSTAHFRSPARMVSDGALGELFTQASTFGRIPKLWAERVRALMDGKSA